MDIEFDDSALELLAVDAKFTGGYGQAIVQRYRQRIGFIRQARDERDIYAMRSLRFERLKGKRKHQFSLRLDDQWRLIIEIRGSSPNKRIGVVAIEDYH